MADKMRWRFRSCEPKQKTKHPLYYPSLNNNKNFAEKTHVGG